MLTLTSHYDDTIPLEMEAVTPSRVATSSMAEIAAMDVWRGRRRGRLDDYFSIAGEPAVRLRWRGQLQHVIRIGQAMTTGEMFVEGDCGQFAGHQMSGGQLAIDGSTTNHLGGAMTGGTIFVRGSADDHVGGSLPGSKFGMNGGVILIQGTAGRGVGAGMRRGTIVAGGTIGSLAGWNMIAGTIVALDGFGQYAGAGMSRGTLVDAGPVTQSECRRPDWVAFRPGIEQPVPVIKMLQRWLEQRSIPSANGAVEPVYDSAKLQCLSDVYRLWYGDELRGGKGELFLRMTDRQIGEG